MAFASSRIGAQEAIIKPCDLCEDEENVYWFCKDCDQSLCDRCKKSHLKSKVSKSHTVLSISEGFAIAKRNISNICTDHDEPFLFFCQTCDKTICSKCLSTKHKKHDFSDLRDLQSEMQKKLDCVVKEKEEEKRKMTKNYEDLVHNENQSESLLMEWSSSIDDRVKAITLATEEEGRKLKKSLHERKNQINKEAKEGQHKLQTQTKVYDEKLQTVQQELRLQSAASLNSFVRESTSNLKSLRPLSFVIPNISQLFSEGKIDQNQIREMIGNIGKMTEVHALGQEDFKGKVEMKRNVSSRLKFIRRSKLTGTEYGRCFCISPDGSIWIGGSFVYRMMSDCSTILQRIPAENKYTAGRTSLTCASIACLQSGDAVVSYFGGIPFVDRYTSAGRRVDCFIDLTPNYAYDIAVTSHDQVVVGVQSNCIAIFSNEGKQIKEIRVSEGARKFCIARDENIIIAYHNSLNLDILNGRSGKVETKWPLPTSNISCLTCDRYGNVLASNGEKGIHLFSENGEIKRTFSLNCDCIMGLTVNCEDHLLILLREDNKRSIIVAKYLE